MTFTDGLTLKEHVGNCHSVTEYTCDLCDYKTTDGELLDTHKNFTHGDSMDKKFECNICENLFDEETDLEDHKQLHHEATLSFLCDLCAHTAATDEALNKHRAEEHPPNPVERVEQEVTDDQQKNGNLEENLELKRKLRLMEDSYDRLMAMFQKQQSECKDKALAYKTELEEVNECFRVAKTENEKLKEINETQHKLWKIFLDKFEKDNNSKEKIRENQNKEEQSQAHDKIEFIDDDEDSDELDLEDSYQEWLKDTRRGFKRSGPASSAEKNWKPQEQNKQKQKKTYAQSAGSTSAPSPPEVNGSNFIKYCHYWNNVGKCNYEDCKFEHQIAPVCNYDGDCTRSKCMFSHKKQNVHFLSKKSKPAINPWQAMMAPWSNPFAFQSNPWQNQSPPWQNQSMGRRNAN